MSFAYLKSPNLLGKGPCPIELVRIYQNYTGEQMGSVSLKPGGISWMVCFVLPDLKSWYEQVTVIWPVVNALQLPSGWRIHGDLQFGNLVVP